MVGSRLLAWREATVDIAKVKALLLAQTVRPDSVTVGGATRLVPGFTSATYEKHMLKADAPLSRSDGFRELPMDDLVALFEGIAERGKGTLAFSYEGIDLTIDGANFRVR